jgi:ATP-dependent helicase Lhr and Lhr-like helicase
MAVSRRKTNPLQHCFPALQAWFAGRFAAPTEVQAAAFPHTLQLENTLILAPTGSGKTLAAFLSVLSDLGTLALAGKLSNATYCVYVSPLRSLSRDMLRNLQEPLAALNAALPATRQISMELRTGDTENTARQQQIRRRPHLLLTTPETLSSLLSQTGWREGFAPRTVIVDEIHSFAESKRGSLLALSLERLEDRALQAKAKHTLQRIGLSATAQPLDAVRRLLCGERECVMAEAKTKRQYELTIAPVPEDTVLPAAGFDPFRVAHICADLVRQAQCTLLFTATRSSAERLGLALRVLMPEEEERIAVHHASLDRESRLRVEDELSAGTLRAVACSTSLEMGLDFAGVDQVLLIGAPRGVNRAIQRLGRSGHRVEGIAKGALTPLSLPDLLECIAMREAVRAGRQDALRIPETPLDVLAQVLLGMAVEKEWEVEAAWELVRRAGPYRQLARQDFDAVLHYLAGGGRVLGAQPQYGKIILEAGRFRVASRRTARTYYQNIGTISDDFHVKVLLRGKGRLGEVEEGFISMLRPNDAFIIAGRSVKLKRLDGNDAIVEPATGERVQTPRWMGGKMSLTARMAEEELRLRRSLHDAWTKGGEPGLRQCLRTEWRLDADTADRAADYAIRQIHAARMPLDSPVLVERIEQNRSELFLFHVIAGRAVNRSLAWATGQRLGQELKRRGGSLVANYDDHGFVLSFGASSAPDETQLRAAFHPDNFRADLQAALEETDTLGRKFRPVCETGQLLARRNAQGPPGRRQSSWNGSLLYETFRRYEPEHPLLREAVREVLEDELDVDAAAATAAKVFHAPWEVMTLPRPSPFALPLFAFFNRETLLRQDPDRAIDEITSSLYAAWDD